MFHAQNTYGIQLSVLSVFLTLINSNMLVPVSRMVLRSNVSTLKRTMVNNLIWISTVHTVKLQFHRYTM